MSTANQHPRTSVQRLRCGKRNLNSPGANCQTPGHYDPGALRGLTCLIPHDRVFKAAPEC